MKVGDRCLVIGSFKEAVIVEQEHGMLYEGEFGRCFIVELPGNHRMSSYEINLIGREDPLRDQVRDAILDGQQSGFPFVSLFLQRSQNRYVITRDKSHRAAAARHGRSIDFPDYTWIGQWPGVFQTEWVQ